MNAMFREMPNAVRMVLAAVLIGGLAATIGCATSSGGATEFRLASYNIKQDDGREKTIGRTWAERLPKIRKIAEAHAFDLVGFQEVVREYQLDGLKRTFPEFGFIGSGRDAGQKGEGTFIMYRKAMFDLLEEGAFMLAEKPDDWGRKAWDAMCPRVCNWGRFRHKTTGREFCFFNTHLDHRGHVAQVKEMEQVIARMKAVAKNGTLAFLTGDMNVGVSARPIRIAETYLDNAFKVTQTPRKGPDRSWNNWEIEPKHSRGALIDYIFLSKESEVVKVKDLAVLDDTYDGFYPSDHFPLVATIDMKPCVR